MERLWSTSHKMKFQSTFPEKNIHGFTNLPVFRISGGDDLPRETLRPQIVVWDKCGLSNQKESIIWGVPKMVYPATIGFPTKNDHFGLFWGYHHLRKHPILLKHDHWLLYLWFSMERGSKSVASWKSVQYATKMRIMIPVLGTCNDEWIAKLNFCFILNISYIFLSQKSFIYVY